MSVLIDPPAWHAHGRAWSHLVSDTDLAELHAFASELGIPRRAFEGDHYDIPEERYAAVVAAGALEVSGRELLRSLTAAGLRMQKRLGDKGIARQLAVPLMSGAVADVDLFASSRPMDERRVFAAMVFLRDAAGDLAVVHSDRRQEWGSPGGWREGSESVRDNAVREVSEETGIDLRTDDLRPCGYERFRPVSGTPFVPSGRDILQAYVATVPLRRPSLSAQLDDTTDRRWVTPSEYGALCGHLFWWPLAQRALELD